MRSTTAEEVARRRPQRSKHTHHVGVLGVGEQHRGGTVLPGFGAPVSVASQQVCATAACFFFRAAPTAPLAGGDVLLVGAGSPGADSVSGQKMSTKARTHSFGILYQSDIG